MILTWAPRSTSKSPVWSDCYDYGFDRFDCGSDCGDCSGSAVVPAEDQHRLASRYPLQEPGEEAGPSDVGQIRLRAAHHIEVPQA